jgi:hypothetical protein
LALELADHLHDAVMTLLPEERLDREKVNEAVRDGLILDPLRPAGRLTNTAFRERQNSIDIGRIYEPALMPKSARFSGGGTSIP